MWEDKIADWETDRTQETKGEPEPNAGQEKRWEIARRRERDASKQTTEINLKAEQFVGECSGRNGGEDKDREERWSECRFKMREKTFAFEAPIRDRASGGT
jgi:hypothetical protein